MWWRWHSGHGPQAGGETRTTRDFPFSVKNHSGNEPDPSPEIASTLAINCLNPHQKLPQPSPEIASTLTRNCLNPRQKLPQPLPQIASTLVSCTASPPPGSTFLKVRIYTGMYRVHILWRCRLRIYKLYTHSMCIYTQNTLRFKPYALNPKP